MLVPINSFVVNASLEIVDLGEGWVREAVKGKAAQSLAPQKVIGHNLNEFIADDNTRLYMNALVKLCQLKNEVIRRDYRCDSPTHKRFMQLEMLPLADGLVQVNHYLLLEEPFQKTLTFDFMKSMDTHFPDFFRCSICNRLQPYGDDRWFEPEDFGYLNGRPSKVIHTLCDDCEQNTLHSLHPTATDPLPI